MEIECGRVYRWRLTLYLPAPQLSLPLTFSFSFPLNLEKLRRGERIEEYVVKEEVEIRKWR